MDNTTQTYTVEFVKYCDSYPGTSMMEVEAKSVCDAIRIADRMLKRKCAIAAYIYNA
jgi:hypothetical protein